MARDLFSNQGSTTVSAGGTTAPAAGTTESWTVASSATFPAASNATFPTSQFYVADPALTSETILVTNVSGTTWSVTRGADGTTPVAHSVGFTAKNVVTATWLQAMDDKVKYNTLNVKDYGAKGDNLTNDQPAIQAALDDAWRQGGAQVIVPRGVYRIMSAAISSSPLKVRSNVRLTLLPGAEIHRYSNPTAASLCWSGDFSQGMAGFNGHKNILIEGGVWDMRNSSSTVSLASDTFTATNTTAPHSLGVMTSGQTWIDETSQADGTSTSGNLGIVSNTAFNPTANTGIASVNAWPDGTTQITVPTVNTTGQTGLVFRLDNAQNYWQLTRDGTSGNARLSYWVQGVETVVAPTNTRAVAAGAILTVTCIGSRIVAGVITAGAYLMSHDTADVAGFTSQRKSGVVITDTTSRLDGFSASGSYWADTFSRTNSAVSLGTTSSGYTWTARSGTLGINTNSAYAPSAGTNISTVDVSSETNPTVTVSTVGTGSAGVIFRMVDSSNYWYYGRNGGTGNAEMIKVVAGTPTTVSPTATQAVVNGNVLQVKVIGYEVQGYVNSTLTHDVNNDSTNYTGVKAGIRIDDTTTRLSSFDSPTAWGVSSGACFSFSHNTNLVWRNLTVRDTHQNSHSIDMQGCADTLVDNVRFLGCVGNSQRGAIQVDCSVNDGLPPLESAHTKNLLVRGCTFGQSFSSGTVQYPRGVESHAGRVGTWYSGIRVIDNYFDVVERAVKGYNWNDGVIANNHIISGWGIEYRPIWTSNTGDTTNRAGVQTSASQAINGVTIIGNTIVATGSSAGASDAAIRVFGETTGHVQQVSITGNVIKGASSIGISMEWVDRGSCTGNVITNTTGHGMLVQNCTDAHVASNSLYTLGSRGISIEGCSGSSIAANRIETTSDRGIYLATSSTDNSITGNTLKSCNTTGGANTGALALSGSANTGNIITGNAFIKGSGTPTFGVRFESTTSVNCCVSFNTFRGWGATAALNLSLQGSPNTGAGDSGALANVNTYNAA